jgi:hypothetical protein
VRGRKHKTSTFADSKKKRSPGDSRAHEHESENTMINLPSWAIEIFELRKKAGKKSSEKIRETH